MINALFHTIVKVSLVRYVKQKNSDEFSFICDNLTVEENWLSVIS
jgi:hypothetical protein